MRCDMKTLLHCVLIAVFLVMCASATAQDAPCAAVTPDLHSLSLFARVVVQAKALADETDCLPASVAAPSPMTLPGQEEPLRQVAAHPPLAQRVSDVVGGITGR